MSDQQIGKKEEERIRLHYFLDAYEEITGEELSIVANGERPDFICKRIDGLNMGVELTKVTRDPGSAVCDRILNRREYMDPFEALDRIYMAIERKNEQRAKGDWLFSDDTILVIQLMDCTLSGLEICLGQSLQGDFADTEFTEIWIADYTEVDIYRFIELFGLHPLKWWGYYPRPDFFRKPYG
ncbi:MAG: hypothetical protein QME90_11285 [Thermodesulfobacteriota bacterium]|nr:hypothetical protein [Thermodesulfobacteriota bacterium]